MNATAPWVPPAVRTVTRDWDRVVACCVGEVCAGGFEGTGIEPLIPARHRLRAMVQRITEHFASQWTQLDLDGHRVVVRGRNVTIDDTPPVVLTTKERLLLLALAERPGGPDYQRWRQGFLRRSRP